MNTIIQALQQHLIEQGWEESHSTTFYRYQLKEISPTRTGRSIWLELNEDCVTIIPWVLDYTQKIVTYEDPQLLDILNQATNLTVEYN